MSDYINEQIGPEVFEKFIKREIHDVVIDAVKRNSYHNRQLDGCFELYGADIGKKFAYWKIYRNFIQVLDANLKPWLIEINRSPSMATDNPILERMVPEMIENMIQIVVDHKLERKNYSTVNSVLPNKEKSRSSFDFVIFSCHGKEISNDF